MLASVVCALTAALGLYAAISTRPGYTDLISGNLGWSNTPKARDYALAIGVIAITMLCYGLLDWLSLRIRSRGGTGMQRGYHHVLLFCLVPGALSVALLFFRDSHDRSLLFLSAVLIVVASVLGGRMARHQWELISVPTTVEILGALTGGVLLGAMSGLGVAMFLARFLNPNLMRLPGSIWASMGLGAMAAFILMVLVTGGARDSSSSRPPRKRIELALIAVQCMTPLLFASLIPPRTLSVESWWFGDVLSVNFWILVWGLIAISYADLIRRCRRVAKMDPAAGRRTARGVGWAISPLCLLAIVSALAIEPAGVPRLLKDDYHWGEFVIPFWTLKEFGWVPYADYTPARGLINYVPGLVTELFANGTAGAFTTTVPIVALLYHAISIGVFVRFLGRAIGFMTALMLPVTGIAEIQILVACVFVVLTWGAWRWRSASWLAWWVVLGTGLVLYAPGQGGLTVLATCPLGLFIAIRAVRHEPWRLARAGVIAGIVAGLLMLATPLGTMVLGAIRYGLEQASVNTVAHSTPWKSSAAGWPTPKMPMPHVLFEFVRAGFPIIAAICGIVAWQAARSGRGVRRTLVVSFGSCVFLYLSLMTFRALGRIDPGAPSRTICATLFGVAVTLPMLIRYAVPASRRIPIYIAILPMALLVSLASGSKIQTPGSLPATIVLRQIPHQLIDGRTLNAPNLGRLFAQDDRVVDIHSLSNALGAVLEPGAGYVDLSNRTAMHFFLDRPPGLNTTAIYNTVHHEQQRRAVLRIHERGLEVAVADPKRALPWDGGGPTLRSPLVWRYLVQRFTPVMIDGWCVLADPDRLENNPRVPTVVQSEQQRRALLEAVFPVRPLRRLPQAWGRSIRTLAGRAFTVVSEQTVRPLHGLVAHPDQPGIWRVGSLPAVFEIDLGESGQPGLGAGLLILNLTLADRIEVPAEIGWSSDTGRDPVNPLDAERTRLTCLLSSGDHIIPLDASPDWLLGRAGRLTITIEGLPPGSEIGDLSVRLGQRTGAREIDQLAREPR